MVDRALEEDWNLDTMLERFVRTTVEMHTSEPRLHHVLTYEAARPPSVVSLLHGLEETMAKGVSGYWSNGWASEFATLGMWPTSSFMSSMPSPTSSYYILLEIWMRTLLWPKSSRC